jgi:AcrR family transcriptional regulator
VRAALELLETDGPEAMTTRRVGQRIGASSMAVYSEFGSMGALVGAVVTEGFAQLGATLDALPRTADPVSDLWEVALAYRAFALAHPHLYAAMFGISAPGGYRRSGDELLLGAGTFQGTVDLARRAADLGRFVHGTSYSMGLTEWTWLHGWVANELSGYPTIYPGDPIDHMRAGFMAVARGFGDSDEAVRASLGLA